jgi:hypothetical protein
LLDPSKRGCGASNGDDKPETTPSKTPHLLSLADRARKFAGSLWDRHCWLNSGSFMQMPARSMQKKLDSNPKNRKTRRMTRKQRTTVSDKMMPGQRINATRARCEVGEARAQTAPGVIPSWSFLGSHMHASVPWPANFGT